jgi:oligopeptidase B
MRNKSIHLFTVVFLVSSMLSINGALRAQSKGGSAPNKAPMAEKKAKTTNIHGDTLVDDYFWLREKNNPAVMAHLQAEEAYTNEVMKPTAALQDKLYKEMLSHIKQTDKSVPYRWGDYFYYTRTEEGKQYPIYCRKKGSPDAPEEIVIDENELAKGQKFMDIGLFVPSDDGNLLAYSTDNTGYRQYTLQIKNLKTGELFPERIERVNNLAWVPDNKTFFYVTEDPVTKRSDKFFRHVLGTDKNDLIYEVKDELFDIATSRSLD